MSLFRRRRRSDEVTAPARLPRRRSAGLLRRERRSLQSLREARVADLGGLAVEMYRYGTWRSDLLEERCAELAGIDERLEDIDVLLGEAAAGERCACGAPLAAAAQFCSRCGRASRRAEGEPSPDDTVVGSAPSTPER